MSKTPEVTITVERMTSGDWIMGVKIRRGVDRSRVPYQLRRHAAWPPMYFIGNLAGADSLARQAAAAGLTSTVAHGAVIPAHLRPTPRLATQSAAEATAA